MHSEAVMSNDVSPEGGDFGLIARFLNGDEGAFETLFRHYQHRFLTIIGAFWTTRARPKTWCKRRS